MQIQSVPYNNFEGKTVLVSGSLTQVCHPELNWTEFFMLKLPESKFRRNSMTSIYANYALYPSVKRTTRLCTRWLTAIGNRFLFSIKWCALSLTHATSTKATQDKGVVVERKRIPRRETERIPLNGNFLWCNFVFSSCTSQMARTSSRPISFGKRLRHNPSSCNEALLEPNWILGSQQNRFNTHLDTRVHKIHSFSHPLRGWQLWLTRKRGCTVLSPRSHRQKRHSQRGFDRSSLVVLPTSWAAHTATEMASIALPLHACDQGPSSSTAAAIE